MPLAPDFPKVYGFIPRFSDVRNPSVPTGRIVVQQHPWTPGRVWLGSAGAHLTREQAVVTPGRCPAYVRHMEEFTRQEAIELAVALLKYAFDPAAPEGPPPPKPRRYTEDEDGIPDEADG